MLTNAPSTGKGVTGAPSRRPRTYLGLVWVFLGALAVIAGIAAATMVLFLALPGRPGASSSMRFDGFIPLPRHGVLSILDYLSLEEGHLYATSITHGTLFDIALDPAGDPRRAHVSEMAGSPAAHGVALLSSQRIGYITRSKINRVDVFDLATLKALNQIPVADDPDAILYIPQSHLIYVANGDAKLATLIDADKRVAAGTIPLGGKPEFASFDPVTGLLFQNLEDTNTLAAVSLEQRAVVGLSEAGQCLRFRPGKWFTSPLRRKWLWFRVMAG